MKKHTKKAEAGATKRRGDDAASRDAQALRPSSHDALQARKHEVLTKKTPSIVASIANAITIKDQDVYFLCDRAGDVPEEGNHGLGLYYQDTRFLSGYTLKLGGQAAHSLMATNRGGFKAVFQLTNPALKAEDGAAIEALHLGLTWSRLLRGGSRALYDVIALENFSDARVELPIALAFAAGFEDVFAIRGLYEAHPGKAHPPHWGSERALCFRYDGADGLVRRTSVTFSERPDARKAAEATFNVSLGPGERHELLVAIEVSETPRGDVCEAHQGEFPNLEQVEAWLRQRCDDWIKAQTHVKSSSMLLDRMLEQSLSDLHVLRSELDGQHFFAAGVPWFATLFGRDSILAVIETLAYHPDKAEGTLRLLARYQGTHADDYLDEEPGRILHELRVGELANIEAVPHDPNYGTVDATPLFLILLARHARWTGRLDLLEALGENVDQALGWIDRRMAADPRGYLAYDSAEGGALVNQGWKDSGNAMVDASGAIARPPIALAEVQGYVYTAKRELADLFARAGDAARAERLRAQADELKRRFNRDFWRPELGCLAMALAEGGRPLDVVSSNAGQALWSGIVDDRHAAAIARRLMASDMFSGWGVRTLSADEKAYNPNSYHLGSVWPHDNALIASGLRRYGLGADAARIFTGMFEAATHFDQLRMPELFTGYGRAEFGEPVRYPVACHPQAWAAGAVPYMLMTLLGLSPDGFGNRLRVTDPLLPEFLEYLELHGVSVGTARVTLRFVRDGDRVRVTKLSGDAELEVV